MKVIPNFLRVDKLIRSLVTPKHTVQSVAGQIIDGLDNGSVTLRPVTTNDNVASQPK